MSMSMPEVFEKRRAPGFMIWSSYDYVANSPYGPKFGLLVLAGIAVMLAGIPLYFLARRK